jgi:hypothetical protein
MAGRESAVPSEHDFALEQLQSDVFGHVAMERPARNDAFEKVLALSGAPAKTLAGSVNQPTRFLTESDLLGGLHCQSLNQLCDLSVSVACK